MFSRVLSVLWLSLLAIAMSAQEAGTAALNGDVVDQSGASMANVNITLVNPATGLRRQASTSGAGLFVFNNLAPGDYKIEVAARGFRTEAAAVRLNVGQQTNLRFRMQVHADPTAVEVHEGTAGGFVDTVSSVVDGIVDTVQIDRLPLNGRNFLELALLLPGNSPAPNFDPTKTNTVVVSSAGQLGRGGNVTIDGADNNDDVVGGMLHNIPEDAVQEFQVATNRFSAELGRSGSSVANVITRSGSNEVHGALAFFERDKRLQGLSATSDRPAADTPPFRRQQYAGSIGGPLVRDRAWIFGAFEYRDQVGGVLVGTRDLATRTITRSFAPAPLNDLLGTTRGDWQVSDRDHLNFRYSIQREEDTAASTLIRALGSATQRQNAANDFQAFVTTWERVVSPTTINRLSFSENNFINRTVPLVAAPQITFPSLQDGASFRVPQQTRQNRLQFSDALAWTAGTHNLRFGTDVQRIDADFLLGVFQQGRIEAVEDFPDFDRNGDGKVDDNDLLFAVTLRSAFPNRPLIIPDADNDYLSFYAQDDWHLHRQFTLNLGLRYEIDTDDKNVSRYGEINPIVLPFLKGQRNRDKNNFGPRVGFNVATEDGRLALHGGYGIYYDRITLEITSLERGLDGRSLPIEVRAGNVMFMDPATGMFAPGAPTISDPFTGFIFPGAGAAGINIIDNGLQNPMVQQFNLGVQKELGNDFLLRADFIHNLGTHFIIGRPVGTVFNPVVGGPDVVKNIESSVNTKYDGLLVSAEKRMGRYQFRTSYTLSKAFNYGNDDQIPFANGPIDPNNLRREYGPTPNDQRHRLVISGAFDLPHGLRVAPLWTIASGVPMDILMPDASSRVPALGRNAGGRQFHSAAELNRFITSLNAAGGIHGVLLPLVSDSARFNDSFNSFDLRVAKVFRITERFGLEAGAEAFNLFNITNILGVSNTNYSGFSNVLARDSNDSGNPGYLRSSSFGRPVSTAGGVFGSGGPRAFQFLARLTF